MKIILHSKEARDKLLSGVEILAKPVKATLGPSGRNILIRNKGEGRPFSTKDGVTVAGQVGSKDPIEQVAIESMQDIANITDEGAGDGTTTATILAEAIIKEGLKDIGSHNLFDIQRGIQEASRVIVELLEKKAINIQDDEDKLKEVAMISSNGDKEIADVVFDAFKIAGKQGIVNIKRSRTFDTYVKSIHGMTLPVGYISPYYVNTKDDTCVLDKPWVLMIDKKINKVTPNLDYFLGEIAAKGESVLIMCMGVDPAVSEMLVSNTRNGAIKLCVTKLPGFGPEQEELLRDLGCVLGKEPFIEHKGVDFESLAQEDLFSYVPRAKEVTVTEQTISFVEAYIDTTSDTIKASLTDVDKEGKLIEPSKKQVEQGVVEAKEARTKVLADIELAKEARANKLREVLSETLTSYEKSQLQTRISRLSDGIAFINIGARSETEFIEKQARVQDALYSIKAAYEEGVIPGGGAALLSLSTIEFGSKSNNESIIRGFEILRKAIQQPFYQILSNVGIDPLDLDMEICLNKFSAGFNGVSKEVEIDMIKAKIIDPKKVTRVALESAVSIASMILTTESIIVDSEVYEPHNAMY